MAAGINDKFRKGTNNFSTTLSSSIVGSGDTTATPASVANLPTDTATDLAIDRVDATGIKTPVKREYVKTVISGSNMTVMVRGQGNSTAQAHTSGAVVESVFTQEAWNDAIDGILTEHLQTGGHGAITPTSVTSAGAVQGATVISTGDIQHRSTSLEAIRAELSFDYVASGCVWSGDSYGGSLNASMTAGVVYIGGKRVVVAIVTAHAFTASKDTYVYVDNTGLVTYNPQVNNTTSPALPASSILLGIIVSAATIATVASVNQGQETMIVPLISSVALSVTDSLGNLICPRDPNRKLLGYRQIIVNASTTTIAQITGLTCTVIIPTGRKVQVAFHCGVVTNSGANVNTASIWDAAVGVGVQIGQGNSFNSSTGNLDLDFSVPTTSTLASRTYNIGGAATGGTTTWNAGSTNPTYIEVTLL
jgi:hypothetical protein